MIHCCVKFVNDKHADCAITIVSDLRENVHPFATSILLTSNPENECASDSFSIQVSMLSSDAGESRF